MFEDIKEVIRSRKRRRPQNRMAKRKRINNDLQNSTQKTKVRATRTPLKLGVNSCAPEGLVVLSCITVAVLLSNDTSII